MPMVTCANGHRERWSNYRGSRKPTKCPAGCGADIVPEKAKPYIPSDQYRCVGTIERTGERCPHYSKDDYERVPGTNTYRSITRKTCRRHRAQEPTDA